MRGSSFCPTRWFVVARTALLLGVLVTGRIALGAETGGVMVAVSSRVERPFTVSGAVNALLPGVGVDLSYQVHDRLTFGAQGTVGPRNVDAQLRARFFAIHRPESGWFVGATGHCAWVATPEGNPRACGLGLHVGAELRSKAGVTVAADAGGTYLWGYNPTFLPSFNLRAGYSF